MTELIALFFIVVSISFLCSLVEAVIIATHPSFVALAVKEEKAYAKILENQKNNLNKPITAIITLNTITNTFGSAAIATKAYELHGSWMASIATGVLTFSILVLGEIFPKVIGANYWKTLVPFATYVVQFMMILIYPPVWLSEHLTQKFGVESQSHNITREEVIASAELSAEEGEIKKQESRIIRNLLTLNSLFVSDIMTPRSVIFALDANLTVAEVHNRYKPLRFSRIPVYEGNLDNVIGITMRYQIHECVSMDQDHVKVRDITKPAIQVPEKMSVSGLLEFLIKKKAHLAIVVDEYGIVTGLVTLEDAIETLLGVEIVDELDHVTDMRQYALEQWNIRKNQGRTP
ncbi:MAG: hemolysin family protein [Bdellovibrionaceae bacterium]|nr:hemolysin family protein [Pseudobdellovibrionaceae bacterium]